MALVVFITHPDVDIDPAIPVPAWRLSARGLARMRDFVRQNRMRSPGVVWSSTERKACDGAAILAEAFKVPHRVLKELGENDRSSSGYLPRDEFEKLADAFFAEPERSVRGWERAVDAQRRIVAAVDTVVAQSPADGDIAIVSHGAVGALLLGHLSQASISRSADQPLGNGGHYFTFDRTTRQLVQGWQPIDWTGA